MGRLPTLDVLRGLAAIAVMLFHCSTVSAWSHPIATNGYLAVDLFFALSGFVIAGAYGDRLRHGLGLARFALLRIARLGPMHVLGQLFGFVLMTAGGLMALGPALAALAPGLMLLPVPVDAGAIPPIFPLNGPAWSLFWELAINLLFAIALPFLTTRRLIAVVIAGAGLLIYTGLQFGNLHVGWDMPHLLGGAPRVLCSFSIGVLIWRFRPRTQLIGSAVLCAVAIACFFSGILSWTYDLPIVLIVFPVTLWFAAAWQPEGLVATACRALGDLSYPLYVLHLPVIYVVAKALRETPHTPLAEAAVWFVVASGLVVASWWVARLADLPAQAFLRQRLTRRLAA
jgi:peptidoglycan/LPS O-acetylase OafA/YrhL